MEFIYSDGGREKYFKAKNVGDCVTRAICNATGKDYLEVYNTLKQLSKNENTKRHKQSSVRNGVHKETWKKYLENEGWVKLNGIMEMGTGIQYHLNSHDLRDFIRKYDTLIISVSKHLTCIKNGKLVDTYDCSRQGTRGVYQIWRAPTQEEIDSKIEQENHVKQLLEMQTNAINETKVKIAEVEKEFQPIIDKLQKKIKELNHQLVIQTNRKNKKIKKIKEQDGNAFCDKILNLQ